MKFHTPIFNSFYDSFLEKRRIFERDNPEHVLSTDGTSELQQQAEQKAVFAETNDTLSTKSIQFSQDTGVSMPNNVSVESAESVNRDSILNRIKDINPAAYHNIKAIPSPREGQIAHWKKTYPDVADQIDSLTAQSSNTFSEATKKGLMPNTLSFNDVQYIPVYEEGQAAEVVKMLYDKKRAKDIVHREGTGRWDGFQSSEKSKMVQALEQIPLFGALFQSMDLSTKRVLSEEEFHKIGADVKKYTLTKTFQYGVLESCIEARMDLDSVVDFIKAKGVQLKRLDAALMSNLNADRPLLARLRDLLFSNSGNTQVSDLTAGMFVMQLLATERDRGGIVWTIDKQMREDTRVLSGNDRSSFEPITLADTQNIAPLQEMVKNLKGEYVGGTGSVDIGLIRHEGREATEQELRQALVRQLDQKRGFGMDPADFAKVKALLLQGGGQISGKYGNGTVEVRKNPQTGALEAVIKVRSKHGEKVFTLDIKDTSINTMQQNGIKNPDKVLAKAQAKLDEGTLQFKDGIALMLIEQNGNSEKKWVIIKKDKKGNLYIAGVKIKDGNVDRTTHVMQNGETDPKKVLLEKGIKADVVDYFISQISQAPNPNKPYYVQMNGYQAIIMGGKIIRVDTPADAGGVLTQHTLTYENNLASNLSAAGYDVLLSHLPEIQALKAGEKKEIAGYTITKNADGSFDINGDSGKPNITTIEFKNANDIAKVISQYPHLKQYEKQIINAWKNGTSFADEKGVKIEKLPNGQIKITIPTKAGHQTINLSALGKKEKTRYSMGFNIAVPAADYQSADGRTRAALLVGVGGSVGYINNLYGIIDGQVSHKINDNLSLEGGFDSKWGGKNGLSASLEAGARVNFGDTEVAASWRQALGGSAEGQARISFTQKLGKGLDLNLAKIGVGGDYSVGIGRNPNTMVEERFQSVLQAVKTKFTPEYLLNLLGAGASGLSEQELSALAPYLTKVFAMEETRNQLAFKFLSVGADINAFTKTLTGISARFLSNLNTRLRVNENLGAKDNASKLWMGMIEGKKVEGIKANERTISPDRPFSLIPPEFVNVMQEKERINIHFDDSLGDPRQYLDFIENASTISMVQLKPGVAPLSVNGLKTIGQYGNELNIYISKKNDSTPFDQKTYHLAYASDAMGKNIQAKTVNWSDASVDMQNLQPVLKNQAQIDAYTRQLAQAKETQKQIDAQYQKALADNNQAYAQKMQQWKQDIEKRQQSLQVQITRAEKDEYSESGSVDQRQVLKFKRTVETFMKEKNNKDLVYQQLEQGPLRNWTAQDVLKNPQRFLQAVENIPVLNEFANAKIPTSNKINILLSQLMYRTSPKDFGISSSDDWNTLARQDLNSYKDVITRRFSADKVQKYFNTDEGNNLSEIFGEQSAHTLKNMLNINSPQSATLDKGFGMVYAEGKSWDVGPMSGFEMKHATVKDIRAADGKLYRVYVGLYDPCRNLSVYIKPMSVQSTKPLPQPIEPTRSPDPVREVVPMPQAVSPLYDTPTAEASDGKILFNTVPLEHQIAYIAQSLGFSIAQGGMIAPGFQTGGTNVIKDYSGNVDLQANARIKTKEKGTDDITDSVTGNGTVNVNSQNINTGGDNGGGGGGGGGEKPIKEPGDKTDGDGDKVPDPITQNPNDNPGGAPVEEPPTGAPTTGQPAVEQPPVGNPDK